MSRTTVLLAVAMLVVAGVPATAAFAQESSEEQPGATFAGVVGVQGAEVEGEVAQRSLDRRLADAESNASKAAVVAGETEDARQQLSELRERRETLDRRYESGEITRGEYRSKLARIGAQIRTLERRLNATAAAAEGLPEETLRERGVNASAIDELRRNASEMAGGEVAEAARGIGGADTGKGLAGDPGPPEDAGNGNDGPPDDAGPGDGDDEDADDRGEGAAGKPDDRGNVNGSEAAGENGEAGANGTGDADGAEGRGNGNRTTGAGESDGNRTDDGGPPGSQDDADDSDDDRGNANHADGGADGSADAGDGNGSGDGSDGANAGGAGSDDADGGDERRGNGNGSPEDGTATPTESPEDDGGDRSVDDGWYLTLR